MRNGTKGRGRNDQVGNGAPGVVRCVAYVRKSTSEGLERDFTSLDNQQEAAEAFVRSQQNEGWQLLPIRYIDGGFSGGTTERPALKRLLTDIEAGTLDNVIVYKVDRLSRSLLDFLNLIKLFEQHGVNLVSITEPINTRTPMGRAFLNILMSFGQMEREVTAERTRDKAHAARRKGKFTGGLLPLGYDRHPDGGRLVLNPTEAARVREIFRLFLANPSLVGLSQDLNRRGWTLKRWTTKGGRDYGGGAFDQHGLRRLLTNHTYIGEVAFDGSLYPAENEAIVDREMWDRVQAIIADRSRQPQRSGKASTSLLAGILRCTACDAPMSPAYSSKGQTRYRYYCCLKASRRGWASCPSPSVPATEIERFVLDQIRAIGSDPDIISRTVEASRLALASRRKELDSEIRGAQDALDAAHACARAKIGSARGARSQRRGFDDAVDVPALEDRIATARSELAGLMGLRIDTDQLRAALTAFAPLWEHMTSVERQRVVRLLIERIDYHGGEGKIGISFSPTGLRTLATESAAEVNS